MSETNGNGLTRWGALGGIGLFAFAVLGAFFVLWSTATNAAKDAASLEVRVTRLETDVTANRIEIATLRSNQIEIDTQLRASIDESNKSLAWQMRVNSMLWERSFKGSHLPTDNAIYSNIASGQAR